MEKAEGVREHDYTFMQEKLCDIKERVMFSGIKLFYTFGDNIHPDEFSRIISPSMAAGRLTGLSVQDLLAQFSGVNGSHFVRSAKGANPYQAGVNLNNLVSRELERGNIIAVDARPGAIEMMGPFYVTDSGHLRKFGLQEPGYPGDRIISRYEEMVRHYGVRARPTVFPSQVTRAQKTLKTETAVQGSGVPQRRDSGPLTKAERWQERKYLIGKGERSTYPDAQIASKRLAENNIAVENAKLSENVYKTTNPLQDTQDVPEGWKDISNNEEALKKLSLKSKMLYDDEQSPNFLTRVYQPDSSIFGEDMTPTVVFRGSRAPMLADGTGDTVKKVFFKNVSEIKDLKIDNAEDWVNNGSQAIGGDSEYYKKAVEIGKLLKDAPSVSISGHSLGGGMASAASIASGKPAWTFNSAGLHPDTVRKYGGSLLGSAGNIQAYRVRGELLTKLQEINIGDDAKDVDFNLLNLAAKTKISLIAPDAPGIKHTLPGGTGSLLDMHGIDQAIRIIEEQKDDDIATLRSRS